MKKNIKTKVKGLNDCDCGMWMDGLIDVWTDIQKYSSYRGAVLLKKNVYLPQGE